MFFCSIFDINFLFHRIGIKISQGRKFTSDLKVKTAKRPGFGSLKILISSWEVIWLVIVVPSVY